MDHNCDQWHLEMHIKNQIAVSGKKYGAEFEGHLDS